MTKPEPVKRGMVLASGVHEMRIAIILLVLVLQSWPAVAQFTAQETRVFAEQGKAASQFHLGFMYYVGVGVSQDYIEAVK